MMAPSTVFIMLLVTFLFISDDVHSNRVHSKSDSSTESPFQILDCGIEGKCLVFIHAILTFNLQHVSSLCFSFAGLVCLNDSDCCSGLTCYKVDGGEEGFCSLGLEARARGPLKILLKLIVQNLKLKNLLS